MNSKKLTLILIIVLSLLLFVFTFLQFGKIFEAILPDVINLKYQSNNFNNQFIKAILFSISAGLTPICLFITWKIAPISNPKNRLFSVLLVIVVMTLAILIKQNAILSTIKESLTIKTQTVESLNVSIPIESVNFEYYLFAALLTSCILNYFILKDKVS